MKKVMAMALTLMFSATAFAADHHNLEPVPADPEAAVALFDHVKYKDHDEIAPCAVPKIIQVKDPCACDSECDSACDSACDCCEPKCVSIKICVPPCGCEHIKVSCDGDRIKYDYGEYAVDVRIKKGYIEVDYQD